MPHGRKRAWEKHVEGFRASHGAHCGEGPEHCAVGKGTYQYIPTYAVRYVPNPQKMTEGKRRGRAGTSATPGKS